MLNEFDSEPIDPNDVLTQTEDYFVVGYQRPDAAYAPFASEDLYVYETGYAIINKDTGIMEAFVTTLPGAYNWSAALQDTLDKARGETGDQSEFTLDPDDGPVLN